MLVLYQSAERETSDDRILNRKRREVEGSNLASKSLRDGTKRILTQASKNGRTSKVP